MQKILIAAVLAISVGGCLGSTLHDRLTDPAQLAQEDDAYCASIGARKGSQEYVTCRLSMRQEREQRVEASRARTSAAFQEYARQQQIRQAQPTMTTCTALGGNTVTCASN